MKKLLLMILIAAIVPVRAVVGENDAPLQVDFSKVSSRTSRPAGAETINGVLYSNGPRMVIKVTLPISQYMIIDSLSTLIYFPGEHNAISIKRTTGTYLPFFQTFAGFYRTSCPIPVVNVCIAESVKKGDSLVTRWVPRDKTVKFTGRIEIIFCRDKPVSTSSYDRKGRLVAQLLYSQDTLINGRHVPMRIISRTIQGRDTLLEDVKFSRLVLGKPAPSEISELKVPRDITVKVIEW